MEPVYNLVAKTKNIDRKGEKYNKWYKIGIAGYADNGKLCFHMDSIPVGWDGWVYLADLKDED